MNMFCRPLDISAEKYRKICSVHANFLCGILLLTVLVLPFSLMADEHSGRPEAPQRAAEGQNQVQTPPVQQSIDGATDNLNEGQQKFLTRYVYAYSWCSLIWYSNFADCNLPDGQIFQKTGK